ncbi:zinc-binding dehydrogenase [Pseudarthrobacter sp. SSS035]|uniref:zinc-binding dehydrogenase n=1 Tax=Pseudarthrobacter sp. SSS035 TaxID=2931399 RepID=UPI00200DB82F|nr:zinc-binding dehydrogenase [Pseudarthrobacter sp. SSS035]
MDTHTRPLTVSAQVWTGGQDFEPQDLPAPELAPSEALARIDLATVCGSDMHTVSGRRPGPFPGILGHEAVGTIVATGPGGVRDHRGRELTLGDRVVWSVTVACGECDRCASGMTAKCRTLLKTGHEPLDGAWGLSGGYASHIHLPRGITLVSVPDGISDLAAAPSACATATVIAVLEAAGTPKGRRVLVSGAGMLGIVACAVASSRGAASVEVRDLNPERLELARKFGATRTTTTGEYLGSGAYDVAVELSGAQSAVASALAALDTGGRLVLAGSVSPGPAVAMDPERMVRSLLTVTGVHNYEPIHLQQAMDFLDETRNTHDWDSLVEEPRPLSELGSLMKPSRGGRLRTSVTPFLRRGREQTSPPGPEQSGGLTPPAAAAFRPTSP